MKLDFNVRNLILSLALIVAPFVINAQTLEEAQKAYNAGVTAKGEGNLQEAIDQFTACAEACEILVDEEEDETAEELLYTVQPVIPGLYLQLGSDQITSGQVNEGIETVYKGREVAELYGDADAKAKAERYLKKVHYKLGASKYKAKDFEAAHTEFDKALALDPEYLSVIYLKSVTYKAEGNEADFKSNTLKGIEIADAKKDSKNKTKLVKLGKGYYLKKGNDAKGASKYDQAVADLNTALEFDATDVTTLYLLSATYLAKGDYANAVETGEKAVANEKGGEEAQAKIYMTIAEAHAKSGNPSAACSTYKKAAVGQYAELANYRIQHELKCE
jgi:tetratricopeptide (TPR) repeat protein